jgi:hypothetical protein
MKLSCFGTLYILLFFYLKQRFGDWILSPSSDIGKFRKSESVKIQLAKTCLEVGTSSIDWTQLSRFHLKTETESSLRNVVLNINMIMDNIQNQ